MLFVTQFAMEEQRLERKQEELQVQREDLIRRRQDHDEQQTRLDEEMRQCLKMVKTHIRDG